MFDVHVDVNRAVRRIDNMPPSVRDALGLTVTEWTGEILGRAKSLASGDVLQVRSGKFVASIRATTSVTNRRVTGRISSAAEQAGIFEFGGKTKPHEISAQNAKALAFALGGSTVFAAHVNNPGAVFPRTQIPGASGGSAGKYSTMWEAHRQMADDINADITAAVDQGLAAAGE
jgi:hypothetical protein